MDKKSELFYLLTKNQMRDYLVVMLLNLWVSLLLQ